MNTKQIRNVDTPDIQHLPVIDFIGNNFVIFDNIEDIPSMPCPTRLNVARLAVCWKGRYRMSINLQEYEMREGMLCIILPEQIVQQGKRSDGFSGNFIVMFRNFMDVVILTMQQLFPTSSVIKERSCIKVTAEESQAFGEYHPFLRRKMRLKDNPYCKEIMQGLLLALFYEIYDIYQGHTAEERTSKGRKEDLFEHLTRYVSEGYKKERNVAYYVSKMFLTPKHLSTTVKGVSGKTTGEWIDNLVILEAKILLKSSERSIQGIANELHLVNRSSLGEYFRHHTGMSPKKYREQQCERLLYNTRLNHWKSDAICSGGF